METKQITQKDCKRYVVYWHKFANSGVWEFDTHENAMEIATSFRKQEDMNRIVVFDTKTMQKHIVKGDDE